MVQCRGVALVVPGTPEGVEHGETMLLMHQVLKSALQASDFHRIVTRLLKGKPAERWGRKATGLRDC
jgi:hypothetical protein